MRDRDRGMLASSQTDDLEESFMSETSYFEDQFNNYNSVQRNSNFGSCASKSVYYPKVKIGGECVNS